MAGSRGRQQLPTIEGCRKLTASSLPDPVLTPRERSIINLVASGMSAKEAAISLEIAPRTVEKHIDQARLKLRAKNRTHLVAMALSAGIITDARL
ncbi:hypothetical protein CLG96_13220 [Sphingomonas oleivorans]|uniref:HTH luxR-type domain-containing protein n=1 Tax=Sphingomonas oleivorans TaxID=1735121 RepID=A0A2T5FX02_9SPHN|nr:helix-turn-helix domain-containing protein [Sphingomonas oleivorans]PTQ10321.1 hypothetical protein CLG96_13220 [Sphingomonas oleivorans]